MLKFLLQFPTVFLFVIVCTRTNSGVVNPNDILKYGFPSYVTLIFQENELGIIKFALSSGVSTNCLGHTLEWVSQIQRLIINNTQMDAWSLQMTDAFAKFPEGVLSGHINPSGDFDECLGIQAINVNFSDAVEEEYGNLPKNFEGKYCTTYLIPSTNETQDKISRHAVSPIEIIEMMTLPSAMIFLPSVGTCFPSTCSDKDVKNLMSNILAMTNATNQINPVPYYCTTADGIPLDAADISFIAILSGIFAICIIAGVYDYWNQNGRAIEAINKGKFMHYVSAISMYTNAIKLLNTRSNSDEFGCLFGLRFLSAAWVVLGHTLWMMLFVPRWNLVSFKMTYDDWTLMPIINATFCVDTFFVMSGMLVAYNLLKHLDSNNGKFNILYYYIHRYLRITVTYAILIGVMATIVPYLGSGPFWIHVKNLGENCEVNWWTNLLYINNFVNTDRQCHPETWYLACDMQFYVLSPLFIYPLWRWKKFGLGFLGTITLGSILVPALLVYHEEVVAPTFLIYKEIGNYLQDIYDKPYSRIQVYLVGIFLGYILHSTKNRKLKIPKLYILCGWLISTGTCLAVMFGIFPWFNPSVEIPRIPASIYAGFSRFGWGVSIAWIIFACAKGYAGFINDILSWKAFIPLSRLTFCIFLLSYPLQMAFTANLKQIISHDTYTMTNIFFAHLLMSILVAFLFTITTESPFIALEKIILGGAPKTAARKGSIMSPQQAVNIPESGTAQNPNKKRVSHANSNTEKDAQA